MQEIIDLMSWMQPEKRLTDLQEKENINFSDVMLEDISTGGCKGK